jgi:hypothetical protein
MTHKLPITPSMIGGLVRMAQDEKRDTLRRGVLPHPNNQTGKALLARGLVEKIPRLNSPWDYYRITPEGYALLEKEDLKP